MEDLQLGDEGCIMLAQILKANMCILNVNLGSNNIGRAGTVNLAS